MDSIVNEGIRVLILKRLQPYLEEMNSDGSLRPLVREATRRMLASNQLDWDIRDVLKKMLPRFEEDLAAAVREYLSKAVIQFNWHEVMRVPLREAAIRMADEVMRERKDQLTQALVKMLEEQEKKP